MSKQSEAKAFKAVDDLVAAAARQAAVDQLAFKAMTTSAILQAVVSILFGASLVWSYTQGRFGTSPSYDFLSTTPGWPWLMGGIYVVFGTIQIYARFSRDLWITSGIAFACQAATTSVFAAAYFLGTFNGLSADTLFGPQWLYPGWAALTAIHAYFAYQASRAGR